MIYTNSIYGLFNSHKINQTNYVPALEERLFNAFKDFFTEYKLTWSSLNHFLMRRPTPMCDTN